MADRSTPIPSSGDVPDLQTLCGTEDVLEILGHAEELRLNQEAIEKAWHGDAQKLGCPLAYAIFNQLLVIRTSLRQSGKPDQPGAVVVDLRSRLVTNAIEEAAWYTLAAAAQGTLTALSGVLHTDAGWFQLLWSTRGHCLLMGRPNGDVMHQPFVALPSAISELAFEVGFSEHAVLTRAKQSGENAWTLTFLVVEDTPEHTPPFKFAVEVNGDETAAAAPELGLRTAGRCQAPTVLEYLRLAQVSVELIPHD